jgi:hypothetical protein
MSMSESTSDPSLPPTRRPWMPAVIVEHSMLSSLAAGSAALLGVTAILQIGISCTPGQPNCTAG